MSVSIHEHEFVVAERDALRREVDRLKSEGDKLDAPAVVGNARFGRGVAWRTVIMAAQRRHKETVTPESEAARLEKVAETNLIVSLRDAEIARLNEELAASQAREQQLREALNLWKLASNNAEESELDDMACYCVPMPLFCDADEATGAALALPQDTTALEAMIAKAGEVMRERCWQAAQPDDSYQDDWFNAKADSCARIRTILGVTLEDLQ